MQDPNKDRSEPTSSPADNRASSFSSRLYRFIKRNIPQFAALLVVMLVAQLAFNLWFNTAPVQAASKAAAAQAVAPGYQVALIADDKDTNFKVAAPPRRADASVGATINVTYTGFTTAAQTAFQAAVDIWAGLITSPVTIQVNANFTALGSGILGSAGPSYIIRDFTGAPQANTWYAAALANKLAGSDLNTGQPDISASFSSSFSNWYFGTDGNTPPGQYDFESVVLHELCHGLGFFGSMSVSSGNGSWGFGTVYPSIYDRYTINGSGQSLINTSLFPNPSSALASQLTSDNVFFNGPKAKAANANANVKLYAPATFSQGSSISHLGENFNGTPNALMTYSIGTAESLHNPGPVALGVFEDSGWTLAAAPPSAAGTLYLLDSPDRFIDTRSFVGSGDTVGTIPAGTARTYTITGRNGQNGASIPAGAKAIVGNLTAISSASNTNGGFLQLYPSGTSQPPVANVNYTPGQIIGNSFTAKLGSDGKVIIYSLRNADAVIDIVGYYI